MYLKIRCRRALPGPSGSNPDPHEHEPKGANERMKKSIGVSPNIETFFGTRDENVRLLEDGLNITINLRSNAIELEGRRKTLGAPSRFSPTTKPCSAPVTPSTMATSTACSAFWFPIPTRAFVVWRMRAASVLWAPHRPAEEQQPAPLSRGHREARHGIWDWSRGYGHVQVLPEIARAHAAVAAKLIDLVGGHLDECVLSGARRRSVVPLR